MRTLINLVALTLAGTLSAQSFLAPLNFPVGSAPAGIVAGDFNRDGKPDIVVSNSGSSNISVFLGIGNGSFRSRRDFVAGSQPQALAAGDFNLDGKLDLAVVDGRSNSILILLGNGDGTFLPAISTPVAGPTALAVADFDGDGKLDLAVGSAASNSVQILSGRGNGLFVMTRSVSVGINPVSLALGDFNSDGRTDIAVANGGSPFVSMLIGDGRGNFQRSGDVYTGSALVSVAANDVNNDGRLDLAVLASSGSASPVIILLGHGDATFDQTQRFPVGGSPLSYPLSVGAVPGGLIAIGDLNNDGVPDLAVSLGGNNSVSILEGVGDGSFQNFVTFPAGAGPSGIAVADLNSNGRLDLAVPNLGSNSFSLLVNVTASPRRPTFTQNSIVNGASFQTGPVVPGEVIAILGSALGPDQLTVSDSPTTTLAGTRVLIGGVAAPLLYVSSTQIGAVVPLELSGILTAGVQITSVSGMSNLVTVRTADAAPGLFSADFSGAGQGVILNQDGSPNNMSNPGAAGSVVTLFGTGGGQLRNVRVTIGGMAADVVQASAAPGQVESVFLAQTRIPSQARTGDLPVVVTVNGTASQPGITIRVQ
jgi:uncharacterized protein (TIGR03437 family)